MNERDTQHLRVLIAGERADRLDVVASVVSGLGHEVVAQEVEAALVGSVTARERPDVALVALGRTQAHALRVIGTIVEDASCPVIVLLDAHDPAFLAEASKCGVFGYVTDSEGASWQSSIDIVLRRFAEYRALQGAFARRAIIERAKGVLMERHSLDEALAFALLRDESRAANRKVVDVAAAVLHGHRLLPRQPPAARL
jgi:response regulator NasT